MNAAYTQKERDEKIAMLDQMIKDAENFQAYLKGMIELKPRLEAHLAETRKMLENV